MVQPLGLTDADRLAMQIRQLAANPRDLNALATAGELSLRVGDLSGAAALFARADKIDPRSGRVKAGMAAILVRSERPGEALRFFGQAEAYGWPALRFAADRGLAYDLIGEQERAQRDYRLALRSASEDETIRRYALSLGISGRQREALAQLDPLVRRQDRAAWRAQAFVLAMGGDTAGAARIATAMMPATMAQGLGAFFTRLPTLAAVDRAFAVHFGEIFATPERLADARLTPTLPVLLPEPGVAAVQVAAVTPPRDRRSRRERERDARRERERAVALARAQASRPPVAVASVTPARPPVPATANVARAPVTLASNQPLRSSAGPPDLPVTRAPLPAAVASVTSTSQTYTPAIAATMREPDVRNAVPARVVPPAALPAAAPLVTRVPTSVPAATGAGVPVTVASASVPITATSGALAAPSVATAALPTGVTPATSVQASILPTQAGISPTANTSPAATDISPAGSSPAATPLAGPTEVATANAASASAALLPAAVSAQPVVPVAAAVAGPPAPVAPVETAAATERTDSVLARIVASLSIPASELGVGPTRPDNLPAPIPAAVVRAPASSAGKRVVAEATAKEARDATVRRSVAAKLTGDAKADDPPLAPRAKRAAAAKLLADKKAAEEKKALAAAAAEEKRIARTKPARIWVQVAGGANESDLAKAWRTAQGKAPALKTRTGYSTPLRATNRVLTGPFKTEAEARTLINQLAKQGVSAFSFTSTAGQDVKALGSK
jgi:tetratricopeptide (TPR) repeat protein